MVELADILRQYGPDYRARFGSRMLPSHRRAMADIEQCRTEAMGGHVYACSDCDEVRYSYHSCQNRHCPKCQNDAADAWLVRQQDLLLPVPYFLLTFTLPDALRQLARSHQRLFYKLLFQASAQATQELARDPHFIGGQIGMVGVLQTWTRDLHYHPHIHYLVPGGGVSPDGTWVRTRNHFFVHVRPLSRLYRAKFRAALQKTDLFEMIPSEVWRQEWVVHCQPGGSGVTALKYLAPYIFRVALSNRRILQCRNGCVTYAYKDAATRRTEHRTLAANEFLRRFLQHVLPRGFVKVRYFGLFSPRKRALLHRLRLLLGENSHPEPVTTEMSPPVPVVQRCSRCGQIMLPIQRLRARIRCPP